jgi:hypothetical protein
MIRKTWSPDLVEEAVLASEPWMTGTERSAFRRERDRVYEIGDADLRERRFQAVHQRWFTQLALDREIERAIDDTLERSPVEEARLLRAIARRDEGADLVDSLTAGSRAVLPVLVIRLRPGALLDPSAMRQFLDHELMHVRDILDPAFGYERTVAWGDGPLPETAFRERYRVLWDVAIDGRLVRAGRIGAEARVARLGDFARTFPMLGDATERVFDRWFGRRQPTHADMVAFARTPALLPDEVTHADIHAGD